MQGTSLGGNNIIGKSEPSPLLARGDGSDLPIMLLPREHYTRVLHRLVVLLHTEREQHVARSAAEATVA
jgi:hypothetical protein